MKRLILPSTRKAFHKATKAFSMIEILVVVGIMSMLIVMGGPTMTAMFSSSKVGQASQHLANFLQIAHQTAIKENLAVEVRFYKYENKNTPQKDDFYQAYRMFRLKPNSGKIGGDLDLQAEGIEPLQKMPGNCYITEANGMSTLLTGNVINNSEENVRGIESGKRVTAPYKGFVIRPDGSLNLPLTGKWFLTVLAKETHSKGNELTPENYVCILVNPANGELKQYTP